MRPLRYALCFFFNRVLPRSLRRWMVQGAAKIFGLCGTQDLCVYVNDEKIHVDPRDYFALSSFGLLLYYDKKEIAAVKREVPSTCAFIDVGANFGAWTFPLARHFSQVIAVEPARHCCAALRRTVKDLGLKNVVVVNAALSDHDGEGILYPLGRNSGDGRIYDPHDAGRGEGSAIQLMTLDTLVNRLTICSKRLFIKMDVQGAEPLVLRGMRQTLEESQEIFLWTEMTQETLSPAGFSVEGYLDLLREFGFVPVALSSESTPKNRCFRFSKQHQELAVSGKEVYRAAP